MTKLFYYPFTVHFPDTDAGGLMYHGRYVELYDRARFEMFNEVGINLAKLAHEHIFFPVADLHIRYLKPLVLNQQVLVESSLIRVGKVTLYFQQSVCDRADKGFKISYADVKIGCLRAGKIAQIPQQIKEFFE